MADEFECSCAECAFRSNLTQLCVAEAPCDYRDKPIERKAYDAGYSKGFAKACDDVYDRAFTSGYHKGYHEGLAAQNYK